MHMMDISGGCLEGEWCRLLLTSGLKDFFKIQTKVKRLQFEFFFFKQIYFTKVHYINTML